MYFSNSTRTFFGITALAGVLAGAQGCVADRPSRNGVFDENQYVRKDFLVQPDATGTDQGWFMKATIVQTSTPNPLSSLDLFVGRESEGMIGRFVVTSDKMQFVDARELSNSADINAQQTRTPALINAWPITNVDLKYQINLDGEKTNFYQENQELDWQVRQWVKVNFDKNDLSDIAGMSPLDQATLAKCATGDSTATLIPNSFMVDTPNNYMQWAVAVTVTPNFGDADCATAFGSAGHDFQVMGRQTVTFNVLYSAVKAQPVDPTSYTPLVIDEKDGIRHKYGPIEITNYSRDLDSGLLAARQLTMRFNPNKPLVWYFAPGYPQAEKDMWTRAGGIVDQTNAAFKTANPDAKGIQLKVLNYNDATTLGDGAGPSRAFGDIRYNFIRWITDPDADADFLGVTQFQPDLRTGELISASINIAPEVPLKYYVGQITAAYLKKVIGADPFSDNPDANNNPQGPADPQNPGQFLGTSCNVGQSVPIVSATVQKNIYANSTLYQRMAQYLPPPPDGATSAAAGPTDYIYQHPGDDGATFYQSMLALVPYTTYADPMANQFVTPRPIDTGSTGTSSSSQSDILFQSLAGETAFQNTISDIDHGRGMASLELTPGAAGMQTAFNAADNLRQALTAHHAYNQAWNLPRGTRRLDTADVISLPGVISRSSRQCIDSGSGAHWETFDEWQTALLEGFNETTIWHEFGHTLGLDHNFMGSVDRANFPTYTDSNGKTQFGKLTSSIMEYSITYDDSFWNNGSLSGQSTPTTGWLAHDLGAIGFLYSNNLNQSSVGPNVPATPPSTQPGISGQYDANTPWHDPYGFNGSTEINFLYCNGSHLNYTPLCRMHDVGTTPSEITAADIENYEWNYQWRNFRNVLKVWDDSNYGTKVADIIDDQRRFIAMDVFDWNQSELTDKLIRIGVAPPPSAVNTGLFYSQLTNEFASDIFASEELSAAFHEAIIQQGTGQRPYATTYDPYFGDVTQQGISLDKAYAFTYWLGLWPYNNFDPSQAEGLYGSSMTVGPGQTGPQQAWSTVGSMLGEKGAWDAYPVFFPSAVSLFAHDTNDPYFIGLGFPQMRDWIGGHTFSRIEDALAYFRQIAAQFPAGPNGCASYDTCTYNPMTPQANTEDIGHTNVVTGEFFGPDNRHYVWMHITDRNEYFFVDKDRNPSTFIQVQQYNQDLNTNFDDGTGPIYSYEANIKYMIDAYDLFGGDTQAQ